MFSNWTESDIEVLRTYLDQKRRKERAETIIDPADNKFPIVTLSFIGAMIIVYKFITIVL